MQPTQAGLLRPPTRASPTARRARSRRFSWWWGWLAVGMVCGLLLGDHVASPTIPKLAAHPLFGQTACHLPPSTLLPPGAFFDHAQATTLEQNAVQVFCAFSLPIEPPDLLAWYQARLPDLAWSYDQDRYEGHVLVASSEQAHLALRIIQAYGGATLEVFFAASASAGPLCQPPDDVSLPAGRQLFSVMGLAGALNCTFILTPGFLAAFRFFQRELPAHGWQLAASNDPFQHASAFLAFIKDTRRAYFNLFLWPGLTGPVLLLEVSILPTLETRLSLLALLPPLPLAEAQPDGRALKAKVVA